MQTELNIIKDQTQVLLERLLKNKAMLNNSVNLDQY